MAADGQAGTGDPGGGLPDERHYTEIRQAASRFADAVAGADETGPVPTCPDWTLRQLTAHVGRIHRWAAVIVTRRLDGPISFRDVPDGALPADPVARTAWLNAGAAWVTDAVRAGGQDKVWMLSGLVPASRWARRVAHETAMHAVDAQLATGHDPQMDTDVAADGIDERLDLMAMAPGAGGRGLPEEGQSLHVHATDETGLLAGLGEWLIRQTAGGITVEHGHDRADVAVRGPAAALVMVLQGRLPVSTPGVEVLGEPALLDHWLASTAF